MNATAPLPSDGALLRDCVRSALARAGREDWSVTGGPVWCSVRPPGAPGAVQGWKLHVSATPLSAPLVLSRCAEVLAGAGCPFKYAADLEQVRELVAGHSPRGGGGKFVTAYPDADAAAWRELAFALDEATRGLPGPGILSDRPVRPGSLVHYRFGVFDGVPMLSADGTYEAMLAAPDGRLVLDSRRAWFTAPDWAPPDPLAPAPSARPAPRPRAGRPAPVLLGGRYLVTGAIRHSFTGGVFRAADKRTGREVVVKQARRHSGADLSGGDATTALRREADLLARLAPLGLCPGLVETFQQQGDLFLVEEALDGVNLRQWAAAHLGLADASWGPPPAEVARIGTGLCEVLGRVHAEGLVLRDLSPGNVMVGPDLGVRLVDLELAAVPGAPVVRAYTPGYAAPEQVRADWIAPAPDQAADLYGLGATLFHLATGIDPHLTDDVPTERSFPERVRAWLDGIGAGNTAATALARTLAALLDSDPARRPGLGDVAEALARLTRTDPAPPLPKRRPAPVPVPTVEYLAAHIVAAMDLDAPVRLWPQHDFAAHTDPLNVQHGAAGVLGALLLPHRADRPPALRAAIAGAAHWIVKRLPGGDTVLPGLQFGRSGTAWALLDTGLALGDDSLVDIARSLAAELPRTADNPDVCHGLAGAGLTMLRFAEATGDPVYTERAAGYADLLADRAEHADGVLLWPVPATAPSVFAGTARYGFAHGTAGIGAFLLAAADATRHRGYAALAAEAAMSLVGLARVADGAARWPDEAGGPLKTHWCAGSSGIGTFLVRYWAATGDPGALAAAEAAAVAVRRSRRHIGTSQCHGLAGDGEFLLDMAAATGDARYPAWALELRAALDVRATVRSGRVVVPDESGAEVYADFGTGLAGVLAFLTRLRDGGSRPWLPETFAAPRRAENPDDITERG